MSISELKWRGGLSNEVVFHEGNEFGKSMDPFPMCLACIEFRWSCSEN